MIHAYNASSADAIWRQVWADSIDARDRRLNGSKGHSRELLHAAFSIEDPRQRWVFSRTPGLNPAFAIAEIVWIVSGRRDASFLQPWNTALTSFTGDEANLHGAYGHRLRHHFGFDQLKKAAAALRNDPNQRQIVLQVWDTTIDAPHEDGTPRSGDIPCNVSAFLKISKGRLEWLQVMRSNDLVLGLPYNILQWTTLQEIIAGWLEIDLGSYNQISDSLHIYDRDIDTYQTSERQDWPLNQDDLRLTHQDSQRVFSVLAQSIQDMANASEPQTVRRSVGAAPLPGPYADWLRVMACERLRRISCDEAARQYADDINSPVLRESLRLWRSRFKANS